VILRKFFIVFNINFLITKILKVKRRKNNVPNNQSKVKMDYSISGKNEDSTRIDLI
jgi:hypothetical protein